MSYIVNILFILTIIFVPQVNANEQKVDSEVQGVWSGNLKVPGGVELPLVFHVRTDDGGLAVTMDSPKQGGFGIPVDAEVKGKAITFKVSQIGMVYSGQLEGQEIIGKFSQRGFQTALDLSKKN